MTDKRNNREDKQTSSYKSSEVREQMYIAQLILNKLQTIDPKAVIAGGAPRDWYLNKTATDIDIFYHFHGALAHDKDLNANLRMLQSVFPDFNIKTLGVSGDLSNLKQVEEHANYLLNPNIRHVFEFTYRGQVFQLIDKISYNSPIDTFPYNMCQAWSNGVEIFYTPLFKVGVEKELLIETGSIYCSMGKYQKKMQEKFPNYTYIASRIVVTDPFGIQNESQPALILPPF